MTDVNHRLSIGDTDDIFGQISNSMYFGLKPPQNVSRMAEKLFHKTPSNCVTEYRQNVSRAGKTLYNKIALWDKQTRFICPTSCLLGELAAVELGVKAACREQFIVRAALDNLAIAHY